LIVALGTLHAGCTQQPLESIDRAVHWMLAWEGEPDFDALIVTDALARRHPTLEARALRDRMATRVDPDGGHPLRRLIDPGFRVPVEKVTAWQVRDRVPFERVLVEAAHCADHGLRPETAAWICGGMRDGAGWGTTHALWAAVVARDAGCVPPPCIDALVDELSRGQPAAPGTEISDIDLFAERLLMRRLAGANVPERETAALRGEQQADGAFGPADPAADPRARLHATMVSAWALSLDPTDRAR
jgi:hypothetical protein